MYRITIFSVLMVLLGNMGTIHNLKD